MQRQYIFLELHRLTGEYKDASRKLHHTISYVDSLRREKLLLVSEHLQLLSLVEDQDKTSANDLPDSVRSDLPKSIAIRSSGFLAAGHRNLPPRGINPTTVVIQVRQNATIVHRFECGGEGEVVAYSQGTTKTELCNKWDEMGCCPYAERCRFAHGINELRPVIRHPRYKTQICRMLGAGNGCPYGHRCHFRHSSSLP
ncbi:putative zinc finger CCCH domain-containing protein 21 [Platanthera guangdongensis]|uniref:Zinc finger CCCH domain-containing protein 21 n=1 Tax=Platanthera guangdongensis TaxID=2320717 RepID=A0ABR2LZ18_9ASPA